MYQEDFRWMVPSQPTFDKETKQNKKSHEEASSRNHQADTWAPPMSHKLVIWVYCYLKPLKFGGSNCNQDNTSYTHTMLSSRFHLKSVVILQSLITKHEWYSSKMSWRILWRTDFLSTEYCLHTLYIHKHTHIDKTHTPHTYMHTHKHKCKCTEVLLHHIGKKNRKLINTREFTI